MTPDELRELIVRWEGPHIDFKRSIGSTIELAKDLVCFANGDGGQLVVGVSEDREIVGVKDADNVMTRVDQAAFDSCYPPVSTRSETVLVEGKTVVIITVARGDQRPYSTREGKYYIRSGSRCRMASREELLRLFQATSALFYDEQPRPRLDLSSLDLDEVERHASERLGSEARALELDRLLHAWRLADGPRPTVGGMVLFGRVPQQELESTRVVAAAFRGNDSGADMLDRTDVIGGLFDVVDQLVSFLRIHLPTGHEIRAFEPEQRPSIPEVALREAIINALVHRDYTISGPIRLFVFDDRVEVHSPGRPPNSVDDAAMRAGIHVTRNPHIYSRVADAELASRAGTGIRRISRVLREAGLPELGISISDAEVILTMRRAPRTPPAVE